MNCQSCMAGLWQAKIPAQASNSESITLASTPYYLYAILNKYFINKKVMFLISHCGFEVLVTPDSQ